MHFVHRLLPLWLLCGGILLAENYYVSNAGNDGNAGKNRAQAFQSIKKALSVLQAGDTLNIAPGEYYEGNSITFEASPDKTTTIRGEIPDAVFIRGDQPVANFSRVPGLQFVWVTDWDQPVEAVNECDNLEIYEQSSSPASLDYKRAAWFYDPENKKLYVVTSDSESPERHTMSVSVNRNFGLLMQPKNREVRLCNIVVENLTFVGFNCNESGGYPGNNGRWGLYLLEAENCIIRNCQVYLSGGGIGMGRPNYSLIENCVAMGNGSQFCSPGGNIVCFTPAKDSTIRNCVTYKSQRNGIRFYGSVPENCLIENCLAWAHVYGDIWIKPAGINSRTRNCVALGGLHSKLPENDVCGYNGYNQDEPTMLVLSKNKLDLRENLADIDNMDYRPQGDSKITAGLPDQQDVFFVSPDGADANDGRSIRTPWRTLQNLKSNTTVYLLPGEYNPDQEISADNLALRKRGTTGPVIFRGGATGLIIKGTNIKLDGLNFSQHSQAGVKIQANNCEITRCSFAASPAGILAEPATWRNAQGIAFSSSERLLNGLVEIDLNHNAFAASLQRPIDLGDATAIVRDNIFAGSRTGLGQAGILAFNNAYATADLPANELYACQISPEFTAADQGDFTLVNNWQFNGRGSDLRPIGPYNRLQTQRPTKIFGPKVHSVTPHTVNVEWWTSADGVNSELSWGDSEKCSQKAGDAYSSGCYHSVSLTGLEPDKKYYFRVDSRQPAYEFHTNRDLAEADLLKPRERVSSEICSVSTPATAEEARQFYVATDGDDNAVGSREQPWQTVAQALTHAKAGDTVFLREGTYLEQIFIRASGEPGRPLTLRNAPGEKVWLEGSNQKLICGIIINNKHHVVIEGFYLRNYGGIAGGAISINGGSDILVQKIFYDGRSPIYTPPALSARMTSRLTVKNCFYTRGFHGLVFYQCPDLEVAHCVAYITQIGAIAVYNLPQQKANLHHNLLFDGTLQKLGAAPFNVSYLEPITENYNCVYPRVPGELKAFIRPNRLADDSANDKGFTLQEYEELLGLKSTSFFANPDVPALPQLISFSSIEDWKERWQSLGEEHQTLEYKKISAKEFAPLDAPDFFPRNPACQKAADGKPIGLEPEVWK